MIKVISVIWTCLILNACTAVKGHRYKPVSFLVSKNLAGKVYRCTTYTLPALNQDTLSDTMKWRSKEIFVFNRKGKIEKVYNYNNLAVLDGSDVPYQNIIAKWTLTVYNNEEEKLYEYYADGNLHESYLKHYDISGRVVLDTYEWTDQKQLLMHILQSKYRSVAYYDYHDGVPQRKSIAKYTRNGYIKTDNYSNDSLIFKQSSQFDKRNNLINFTRLENELKQETIYSYNNQSNSVKQVERRQSYENRDHINTIVTESNQTYSHYDDEGNWLLKVSRTKGRTGASLTLRIIEYYH